MGICNSPLSSLEMSEMNFLVVFVSRLDLEQSMGHRSCRGNDKNIKPLRIG